MRNRMRFFGGLLGSALLLLASMAANADLVQFIKSVKPGVVAIGAQYPAKAVPRGKPAVEYWGTGFAIGDGTEIVTNYHVVTANELDVTKKQELVVFVGEGNKARAYPATVHKADMDHDLAILKIGGAVPSLSLSDSSMLEAGSDIAFIGYPLGMVLGLYPVTHKGMISTVSPIVLPAFSSKTLTAAQIRRLRDPLTVYQLDATAYPGNSGSPLFDVKTGKVVGIINSVFVKGTKETAIEKPSGITYAIPVKYLHALRAK
jgi:serine protease Do